MGVSLLGDEEMTPNSAIAESPVDSPLELLLFFLLALICDPSLEWSGVNSDSSPLVEARELLSEQLAPDVLLLSPEPLPRYFLKS